MPRLRSNRLYDILLCVMLCTHGLFVFGITRFNYITIDESGHVASGLSHWISGRFDAYRVNPPLSRLIAALPVLAARPNLEIRWTEATLLERSEWILSRHFVEANLDRHFDLYRLARLPGIAWSIFAGIVIAKWARDLHGRWAGLFAAALWSFDPLVLGFSSLVTPDIPAASMGVAASYAYWKFLNRPSRRRVVACGLLLGLAELTKFTNLLLYALWPLLALFSRRSRVLADERQPNKWISLAMMFVVSLLVVNAGYLFRGSGQALGNYRFVSTLLCGEGSKGSPYANSPGNRFSNGFLSDLPIPLPADLVQGVDVQRRDFESGMPSYLDGVWRNRGWWYYYIHAFCVKEPTGFLLLVGLAAIVLFVKTRAFSAMGTSFTVLLGVGFFAFVSSQTGFNHHLRYVLPAYPYLFVATSRLCDPALQKRRLVRLVVMALLAWGVLSSLLVYPHSMSHFNEISGGPERGDEHLVDSNIDWGQDLAFLKKWLKGNPQATPIGISCFGSPKFIDDWFEVPTRSVPALHRRGDRTASKLNEEGPLPGYFAVSVHVLRGGQYVQPSRVKTKPIVLEPGEGLTYFQFFKPIARVGYSIRIYHITEEQANAVRERLGLPKLQ